MNASQKEVELKLELPPASLPSIRQVRMRNWQRLNRSGDDAAAGYSAATIDRDLPKPFERFLLRIRSYYS